MGLGGCYSVVKFLVVLVNFLFWVVGLATVALAVWMLVDPTFYVSMAQDSNNYYISTYILLSIGTLLVIVAFLGCCGAFRESQCMLISFFSILLIVLVAQIAAAVWMYINADSLEPLVKSTVKTTVLDDYFRIESRRHSFDTIQQGLECCGAEKPSDWTGMRSVIVGVSSDPLHYNIPKSCCRPNVDAKLCAEASRVNIGAKIDYKIIFEEGCVDKLVDTIKSNAGIVSCVGIGIIVVEFLGLIMALVLVFAINRNGRYKA